MPNWCYTSYVIEGDKEDLEKIEIIYKNMIADESIEGYTNRRWVGHLVKAFGEDPKDYSCRGWIEDLFFEGENLEMYISSAWVELSEVHQLIEEKLPSVKIYFYAEEGGCGHYVTNDSAGAYFPGRYSVDVFDEGQEYYDTEDEVFAVLSDLLNVEIDSIEKAESEVEKYNESHEEEYISFNVIKVV